MKKATLLILSCALGLSVLAQDTAKVEKPWKLTWSGFVNPHFYADTRQVVGGREDMMLFYPEPVSMDANGEDLNASPSLNLLSITARLALGVSGPDFLGAKTRGYIEGDFTGSTNESNNDLRLRHAYINMNWGQRELLIGQFWYAMTVPEIMPGTCPLNMGSPFHPYARYNQARYVEHMGRFDLIGAAQFQTDNKSQGPIGSSTTYLRNSCVPEINLMLRYNGDRLMLGGAANLLVLKPRESVTQPNGNVYKTDQRFSSLSYTLFGRYNGNGWSLKAQTLINDNLYESATMGGYYETPVNIDGSLDYEYANHNWTTLWMDLSRTKGKWRPGLFAGYGWNNDFGTKLSKLTLDGTDYEGKAYGRGFNMEYLWRVQPRIEFAAGKGLSFFAEVEYTFAQYGKAMSDSSSNWYEHDNDGGVANIRYMLSALYKF